LLIEKRLLDQTHRQWMENNRAAIEAFNRRVAEHGLLSDSVGLL
jgi:post-segregation antitoxin (ccd killing protein)